MRLQLPRISEAKDYILTAFLLVISALLFIGNNRGGIDSVRKVTITLFSYLEEPISNVQVYRQALKTNSDLREQNIRLLDELNRLRSAQQRNKELTELLQFSRNSDLSLYPAQIIGKELNQVNNVFTIDAGTNDGIEEGMPMVAANGLIGKVVLASDDYAQVMPYFNTLFKVSATLQNSNAYGIVSWNGENIDELELKFVPQTVPVDTGETVMTSGYSHQFPPNIPVGEVIRYVPEEGKDTQRIFIRPFVNLYTVSEGFVVTTKPDTAVKNLIKEYQELFE